MKFKDRMSVSEVAESLGISRSSVFQLIRNGGLPAYKFRNRVFVDPVELEKYIEKETGSINKTNGKITIN